MIIPVLLLLLLSLVVPLFFITINIIIVVINTIIHVFIIIIVPKQPSILILVPEPATKSLFWLSQPHQQGVTASHASTFRAFEAVRFTIFGNRLGIRLGKHDAVTFATQSEARVEDSCHCLVQGPKPQDIGPEV